MRVLLAALGAVLAFAGCATARYAEVWHKKPQLTGPAGNGRLATVEERLSRAMHEERAKPLAAMADCLEALQFAVDELAEAALERLGPHLPKARGQSAGWTGAARICFGSPVRAMPGSTGYTRLTASLGQ